jgi:putative MATE family efflux protein
MRDFTQGSILRHLLVFSLPMIANNLIQAIYGVIDAFWVGRLVGHEALAAVSTAMPVIFFTASLLIGLGIAATIMTGQAYGARDNAVLSRIISNSFFGSVGITLGLTVAGIILAPLIVHLLNAPPVIEHAATVFLRISIAGFVFITITQWFAGLLSGLGDAKRPLIIQIVTIVLNIILAPIFISGVGLWKPMGVAGSAWATVVSSGVGALLVLWMYRRHAFLCSLPFSRQPDWQLLKRMFVLGVPMSLQMIVVSSSFLLIVSLVNIYGEYVTAAFGIGGRVDQFAFMTILAVCMAISSITAQNIGAGRLERVQETARWGVFISLCFGLFFFAVVNLAAHSLAGFFTTEPRVIEETVGYFRFVSFAYFGIALLFAFQGIARGAGDMVSSLLIVATGMVFLRLPLCWALSKHTHLQEKGLWLGMTLSALTGGLIFWGYYILGRWKKIGAMRSRFNMMPNKAEIKDPNGTETYPL